MVYLDYSATTPVDELVLESFNKVTRNYIGNPNSLHKLGLEAKELMDAATKQVSDLLGVKSSEVIFTSGASEANNLAIKGVLDFYKQRGKHIITTKLEHSSILSTMNYLKQNGYEIDYVKINDSGLVDLDDLKRLIRDDTILVSICGVNSEIGLRQPIEEIGKILKEYKKVIYHVDGTQMVGKTKFDLKNVDLFSCSGHKIYGLKGIGCLVKKEDISLEPIIHGGKSQTIYRSGTPTLALIVSFAKALKLMLEDLDSKLNRVEMLNNRLVEGIKDICIINSNSNCIKHVLNVSVLGIKPETMLHALEKYEIYISTKTACSSDASISLSVYTLTKNEEVSSHSIRISISHLTKESEIDYFIEKFKLCCKELRSLNDGIK